MEINIELDGFYCPTCNDLHPTLLWHDPYDDYATREIRFADWQESRRERPALLHDAVFQESIAYLGVTEHDSSAPCTICGRQTRFTDANADNRICSAECKDAAAIRLHGSE